MKKSDLKVGYLVITDDYMKNIIMPTKSGLVLIDEKGRWLSFNSIRDDLSALVDNNNIIEVYGFTDIAYQTLDFNIHTRELLWRREDEKREMTISEIEKELGYSIKIVKEN